MAPGKVPDDSYGLVTSRLPGSISLNADKVDRYLLLRVSVKVTRALCSANPFIFPSFPPLSQVLIRSLLSSRSGVLCTCWDSVLVGSAEEQ